MSFLITFYKRSLIISNEKLTNGIMKQYRFIIFYSCGDCQSEWAATMYQAVIIAQASRIKDAKDFTIEVIKDEDGKLYVIDTYMSFKHVIGESLGV